jgi:hypothetical protein
MPGSASFDPPDVQLTGFATPVGVYRYDPDAPAGSRYTLLPNVVCDQGGQYREGAEPAVARFRYVFDDVDPTSPFPRNFAEVWPLTASGPYVVQPDDRIVVRAWTTSGSARVLFDGFAQIPQVDLSEDGHAVSFLAVDVSIRLWDRPIAGARYRNAEDPEAGDVVATDLPVRFNPDKDAGEAIQPNCTPTTSTWWNSRPRRPPSAIIPPSSTIGFRATPTPARTGRWGRSSGTCSRCTTTRSTSRTRISR